MREFKHSGLLSTKPKKFGDETIETIDDITRKNAISIPISNDATPTPNSLTQVSIPP